MPSVARYLYDPRQPTPARGGPSFNPLNAGTHSQRAIERRADVMVFTSAPLTHAVRIIGSVKLWLRVASSSSGIDLIGRLCEVRVLLLTRPSSPP